MASKGKQRKTDKPTANCTEKCLLCFGSERDVLKFGKMYKYRDIYVHYYCLLLSSALVQKGKDSEGIFGFLMEDIRKEARRGEKLKCGFCKAKGATIGCSVKECKTSFHLPCGLKAKCFNEFHDNYDSYCFKHRPRQDWDEAYQKNEECPTCYIKVEFDEGIEVLATPCCHKLFHRHCIQKQALSAGSHHFKCPLCNNKEQFKKTMIDFGIHVPEQDASWELENNAYRELYERHKTCDNEPCLCPKGRQHHNQSGDWQLLICDTCGSKGTHWKCLGSSNWLDQWICKECQDTLSKSHSARLTNDDSIGSLDLNSTNENDIIEIVDKNSSHRISNLNESSGDHTNEFTFIGSIKREEQSRRRTIKRKFRNESEKKVAMKDVGIQCCLVSADQLIDTEPIADPNPYVIKHSVISMPSIGTHRPSVQSSYSEEVIDIEDSDDDCVLLN